MRVGYPCINRSVGCQADQKFRLASFSESRLIGSVTNNLNCLTTILKYNQAHEIGFFRITSDLVPFASHPVCTVNWQKRFQAEFAKIGAFIQKNKMRISMHPGQYTLINAPNPVVVENSVRELQYHAEVLDLLGLDETARIQIHVGGVYGNRVESRRRFVQHFMQLAPDIQRRLAIENDEKNYSLADCLIIFEECGPPIIFDTFHHTLNHSGEMLAEAFARFIPTWSATSGLPMVDYSSQEPGQKSGKHRETIDLPDFLHLVHQTRDVDFDLMLEIKDKEISALKAVRQLKNDPRFFQNQQEKSDDSTRTP